LFLRRGDGRPIASRAEADAREGNQEGQRPRSAGSERRRKEARSKRNVDETGESFANPEGGVEGRPQRLKDGLRKLAGSGQHLGYTLRCGRKARSKGSSGTLGVSSARSAEAAPRSYQRTSTVAGKDAEKTQQENGIENSSHKNNSDHGKCVNRTFAAWACVPNCFFDFRQHGLEIYAPREQPSRYFSHAFREYAKLRRGTGKRNPASLKKLCVSSCAGKYDAIGSQFINQQEIAANMALAKTIPPAA